MNTVNANAKDYIEKLGKRFGWVSDRIGMDEELFLKFLEGDKNDEIVKALEEFYNLDDGFFEEKNYKSPKSLDEILEESRLENEKRWEAYNVKRKLIDNEINKITNSFEGAYFDENELELVFNHDNTLFLHLEDLNHVHDIYSVEQFKIMVINLMFRTIVKSPNGENYLKQFNSYFESDVSMVELKNYYDNSNHIKNWQKNEDFIYLINNNFDFSFKNFY